MLQLPPFRPHPIARGGHLQTIFGSVLSDHRPCRGAEIQVPLPDGDVVLLHDDGLDLKCAADGEEARSAPIALLLHGLGGCEDSGYMLRASAKLRARGMRVVRMSLRGCGAGLALARLPIHAGRSDDVAAALALLAKKFPGAAVHLVGFSLGGNIALKLAGESGERPLGNLSSVMAVAPPIDLAACSRRLRSGLGRFYDQLFLRGLFKHVRQRTRANPAALVRELAPRPKSVFEFDDLFTAPLSGFAGADEYYERASSKPLLPRIAAPTLVLAAASDPIVPVQSFADVALSASTQLAITPCGGHLGYVGRRGEDPDGRWLDWRIVEWLGHQERLRAAQKPRACAAYQ